MLGRKPASSAGTASSRRDAIIGIAVAAAVIVPFVLVLSSGNGHRGGTHGGTAQQLAARAAVISALTATTGSGSFDVTYQFSGLTPAPGSATTTTVLCNPPSAVGKGASFPPNQTAVPCGNTVNTAGLPIHGTATIDTQPYAIVALTDVPGLGPVTVRANDTNLWEFLSSDPGLASHASNAGSASTLSDFASLVEGTLGQREGALAMLSLASSTGYLNLEQQEVTTADPVGSSTVDGVPVQEYRVFITPQQQAGLPGLSDQQSKTITAALKTLSDNGFLGSSVVVSVDPSGYVRKTVSTAEFSDGATAVSDSTLSNFGCAGTVLMPGQPGTGTPPPGCVSPDTGVATTTTTAATAPAGAGSSSVTTSTSTSTSSTTTTTASSTTPTT
jgi:hypothetical protein